MGRREDVLKTFDAQREFLDARVKNGIELYRKGDAVLHIQTADGSALPEDITVEVKQASHKFKFGANLFMLDECETAEKNAIYREKFPEFLNLATLPFYWSDLEPEEGKPRYAKDSPRVYRRPAPDLGIEYCLEKSIEPKLHCLNYDAFTPMWLRGASVPEIKAKLIKRFGEIAARYADKIPMIEVTNETFCQNGKSAFFLEEDFVEWSFREAEKHFPANELVINEASTLWTCANGDTSRNHYYMQVKSLLQNHVPVDGIGFQYHSFIRRESEAGLAGERRQYNPMYMCAVMDLFERLNLPLQITEMTIPAYSWEAEDEAIQAEVLKNVYSMFFAQRGMEAIIYWNVPDGYAYRAEPGDMTAGENYYHGGLLRFDMSEKPAWKVLRQLINEEWHTEATLAVKNGRASFRGFFGDYEIVIHAGGKAIPAKIKLEKGLPLVKTITI